MPAKSEFWNRPWAVLRYAFVGLVYVFMRTLAVLPVKWQLGVCGFFGDLTYKIASRRRHVVATNIAICFPELDANEQHALVRKHFRAMATSVADMSTGWYGSTKKIRRHVTIEGQEHLQAGLERGRGVILFCGHFTSFEFFFPALGPLCPRLVGMYKDQRNPLMNRLMTKGRSRCVDSLFDHKSIRGLLKELKKNSVAWYASDQSHSHKGSALIPFFGVPAMTNTAISRIAKITGATVLSYFPRRLPDSTNYYLTIAPPLENFPTDDEIEDTRRLVEELEGFIRQCPEQYWWIHQRFKSRPAPYPDVYSTDNGAN